jgi:hypothetical protein
MNVIKVVLDPKKLRATVETERGTTLQLDFPWEMGYPKLEEAVAVLEQRIIKEAKKTL